MDLTDIFDKVDAGDCWQWTGRIAPDGYGHTWHEGRTQAAHRVVYRRLVGDIQTGMTLDHLCRNRACVNPDHLEQVAGRDNILRGFAPPAMNARRETCGEGHPFDETRIDGYRGCSECRRARGRGYQARRRARVRAAKAIAA